MCDLDKSPVKFHNINVLYYMVNKVNYVMDYDDKLIFQIKMANREVMLVGFYCKIGAINKEAIL
jgi:hypothetical protein